LQLKNVFGYLSIYVRTNPTKLDVALFITGLVSAAASGVPFPILGIIFGQLIDEFNDQTCDVAASHNADPVREAAYQSAVNDKVLYVVYLAVAQFALVYIHLVCWSLGGARLAQRLREQYLQKLLHQDTAFFDNMPSGEVSSRLNGDISAIRAGTSEKVGILLSSISFFITAYVVAFIKNAKLAGILIVLIPAYFCMSLVGAWFIEKYSSRVSDHFAASSSIASEALSNVTVVHAFNANDRLETKFSAHLRKARNEGLKKAIANGVQAGCMYFIAYAANGLSFWLGSRMIADNVESNYQGITVGAIFTVIFLLVDGMLPPFGRLGFPFLVEVVLS
jgi:ABC-type multidrug transport system fused ATPase/permease subunit